MIRKIQNNEYLKRLGNMSAVEKKQYLDRVGEWLGKKSPLLLPKTGDDVAQFQNAIQCSSMWNDEECKAWMEGAQLLTAVVSTVDTWLPDMLYVKTAKRAIRRMHGALTLVAQAPAEVVVRPAKDPAAVEEAKPAEAQEDGKAPETFTVNTNGSITASPGVEMTTTTMAPVPVRPKHIDQYVHLLPQKTQEKAATVKGLLRDLDVAREKMRLLADEPKASPDSLATWAKTAQKLDEKVKSIYKELDAEWEKLVKQGRVTVDDLGNAHVCECPAEDAAPQPQELTSEQKARRRDLRKWLVDTRRGNGETREEHVGKWKENFREYLALEGDAAYEDEKVMAAAAHYGIELKPEGKE